MEVIRVEKLGKLYQLGEIGTGTISHDLNRWWARMRGKEDPFAKVGKLNDRSKKADKNDFVWALDDVNFSVAQGDVVGVIGRNGAGKSTLLKILSRITAPTRGNVKIRGRVASLLEVGTGFHLEMTGRENIFMNGTLMGMSKNEIQSKLDEIVEFAGVSLYLDTPVKRYSSGMTVRLGFAVAAFLEPEILIVDEVLAVGDAEFQKKAIGKMQEVSSGQGRTVLFVSHNMAAVQNLCKTGLLLLHGKINIAGSIETVIAKYLSENYENQSAGNLSVRTDRKGTGIITFLSVYFTDSIGNKIDILFSGMECNIVFEMINNTKDCIDKVSIAMGIDDSNGRRLTILSNSLTNQLADFKANEKRTITVKIKRLPLQSQTYFYTLFTSIKGDISDWVINVGKFNVEEGDFFGTGKVVQKGQGSILVNHEFIY